MDKLTYGMGVTAILSGVLCYSWVLGHDGIVTTGVLALVGAISGTLLGFSIAKDNPPKI